MAIENRKYTYDNALLLHDGVAALTASGVGVVAAASAIINLGAGAVEAVAVLDVSAMDATTTDEKYDVHIQGSTSPTFASGIRGLAMKQLGADAQVLADAAIGVGRHLLPFINIDENGVVYPYVRINFILSGTTPSITAKAFIAKE